MDIKTLEKLYKALGDNYKTHDVDVLNKNLIKQNEDVLFLKNIIKDNQKYYRTYFQVSLGNIKTFENKRKFIEDNFDLLSDWWHVDELPQFIKYKDINVAINDTKKYLSYENPFVRRWGYVLLLKFAKNINSPSIIFPYIKNDDEYYVWMAEAWLLCEMAIYHTEETLNFLDNATNLSYTLISKAISKIHDSFRIDDTYKEKFKKIRLKYKK